MSTNLKVAQVGDLWFTDNFVWKWAAKVSAKTNLLFCPRPSRDGCFLQGLNLLSKNEHLLLAVTFLASFAGLLTATVASRIHRAAQPALLYLVPFTLLPLLTMAYLKVSGPGGRPAPGCTLWRVWPVGTEAANS